MNNHPLNCPHCNTNLDTGDIYDYFIGEGESPDNALENAACYGWTKENPSRFSRIVGVYDYNQDRTTHYECPDCKKRIER